MRSSTFIKLNFEVLPHHSNQIPDDLQVDILRELGQTKEDSTQMHWLTMLLQHFEEDSECLFDDRVVVLWNFTEVKSNGIDFFQLR